VNRWAQRHRNVLESVLDQGERLLAADRVLLTSAAAVDLAGARAGRSQRLGGRRGHAALRAARAHGIDLPRSAFVLAVTDRRLLVWRATTLLARPGAFATSIPRHRVVSLSASGRFGFARLRLLLDDGTLFLLRPYGGRRLEHLADRPR